MPTYTAVVVVAEGVSQDDLVATLEGLPEVVTLAFLGPGSLVESVPDELDVPDVVAGERGYLYCGGGSEEHGYE